MNRNSSKNILTHVTILSASSALPMYYLYSTGRYVELGLSMGSLLSAIYLQVTNYVKPNGRYSENDNIIRISTVNTAIVGALLCAMHITLSNNSNVTIPSLTAMTLLCSYFITLKTITNTQVTYYFGHELLHHFINGFIYFFN